ncbi:MAG: Hpt domain-containing protein [Acidobacteria bacterium]|nr:Hpt domain-containing protein [Acidobacteriota bacterium]
MPMVDHELDELKREFLDEARGKVDEMQTALESVRTREAQDRLTYLAHQLKGSGGSYGFQRISTDAAALEKVLETNEGAEGLEEKVQQHVLNLRAEIDRCKRELALAAS